MSDSLCDLRARFGGALGEDIFKGRGIYPHTDREPIEEWAGEASQVATADSRTAAAVLASAPVQATGAGVTSGNELKVCGHLEDLTPSGDGHFPVLKRLAKCLEGVSAELWCFVEEEDTSVSECDLAGSYRVSTANQGRRRAAVVRSTERRDLQQTQLFAEQSGRAPDSSDHKSVLGVERREQPWEAASEHALATSGGAFEQKSVLPDGGDFEGATRKIETPNVGEVGSRARGGGGWRHVSSEEFPHLINGWTGRAAS